MHRFALMILLTCISLAAAQPKIVDLDIGPLVIPKGNGVIAVGRVESGVVDLFRTAWDSEPYARVAVGKRVMQAITKRHNGRGLVIVRCSTDTLIYVVDVARGQVIARPGLANRVDCITADPRETSPYVYYITRNRADTGNCVGRINVATGLDEGPYEGDVGINRTLQLDDDADLFYLTGGPSHDDNLIIARLEEPNAPGAKPRLVPELRRRTNGDTITVNPRGLWTQLQITCLDRYADRAIGTVQSTPACFLRKNHVFFTTEQNKIQARSGNDRRILAELNPSPYAPRPAPVVAPPAPQGGFNPPPARPVQPNMFIQIVPRGLTLDEDSGLLLVRHDGGLVPIPLAHFGAIDEPFVGARLVRASAVIDQELVADLELADAATEVEVVDAPEGMAAKEGKLHWKPTAKQTGLHLVNLRLRNKSIVVEHKVEVSVRRPWVWMPFAPSSLTVTPNSAMAVCVAERPSGEGRLSPNPNGRICAVDLKGWKATGDYRPPSELRRIAVHDKYVFASVGQTGVIKVLQLPTLTERGEILSGVQSSPMWVAGDNLWISLLDRASDQKLICYSVDTLKPVPVTTERALPSARTRTIVVKETITYGGVIYDLKSMKPIGLTETFVATLSPGGKSPVRDPGVLRYFHGFAVGREGLVGVDDAVVPGTRDAANALLPEWPVFVSARVAGDGGDPNDPSRPARRQLMLGVREAATLSERTRIILAEEPARRLANDPPRGLNPVAIDAGKDVVAVAYGEQLFVVSIAELGINDVVAPLEANEPLSRMDAPAGVVTKIPLKAVGGTAPYKWELAEPIPGFEVVQDDTLAINPAEFASKRADAALQAARRDREATATLRDRLNAALGLSIQQAPVVVRVRLRVTDATNRSVETGWSLIVELDDRQLRELAPAGAAVPTGADRQSTKADDPNAALRKRIAELEAENARLRTSGGK